VGVLLGNGDGSFQAPVFLDGLTNMDLVTTADLNGDGIPDIIAGFSHVSTGGSLGVFLGNGDGTFQPVIPYRQTISPAAMATGDFDGDGIVDLAVVDTRQQLTIYRGKGDGTFSAVQAARFATQISSIASGDLNDDGLTDLAVTCWDGNVYVLLGKGKGEFQPPVSYSIGSSYANDVKGVVIDDFNGDGRADLIVTNALGVAIRLGNGDGTFQEPVYFAGNYSWIGVADFNGDGLTDVVVGGDGVTVLLGSAQE
jgi:hypothetical protein